MGRDLGVAEPAGEQRQHLRLARGEAVRQRRERVQLDERRLLVLERRGDPLRADGDPAVTGRAPEEAQLVARAGEHRLDVAHERWVVLQRAPAAPVVVLDQLT